MNHIARLACIIGLVGLGSPSGAAADEFGTAGPFGELRVATCGVPLLEQAKGACDPAPIADQLSPTERSAALLTRAKRLLLLMRGDEAQKDLASATRVDHNNLEALIFSARYFLANGPDEAAERAVNAALLIAPANPYALATRGSLFHRRGNVAGALTDLDAAAAGAPTDRDIHRIRATLFMEIGGLDRAASDLDRALTTDPDDARSRSLRVDLLLRQERYADAIRDLTALRRTDLRNPEYLHKLATARLNLGDEATILDELTAAFAVPVPQRSAMMHNRAFRELALQRAVLLVRANRGADAMLAIDDVLSGNETPAILKLQLFLRASGFADVLLDGKRSRAFEDALRRCFADSVCGRGIVRKV